MNKEILKTLDLDNSYSFLEYYITELNQGNPLSRAVIDIKLSDCFDDLNEWVKLGFDFDFSQVKRGLNYYAIDCIDHIKFITAKEHKIIAHHRDTFGFWYFKWMIGNQCPTHKEWIIKKLYPFICSHTGEFPTRNIEHIIDYITSFNVEKNYIDSHNRNIEVRKNKLKSLQHEFNKIPKLSYSQILEKANHWTDKITKRATVAEDLKGIEEVYSFKNGFKVVEVFSEQSLSREGKLMNHCVGSYYDGDAKIYSLRNKENLPLVTIEYNSDIATIEQIKGNSNQDIKKEYAPFICEFLDNLSDNLIFYDFDGLTPHINIFTWEQESNLSYLLKDNDYPDKIDLSIFSEFTFNEIAKSFPKASKKFKIKLKEALEQSPLSASNQFKVYLKEEQLEEINYFIEDIKDYPYFKDFILKANKERKKNTLFFNDQVYVDIFNKIFNKNYPIKKIKSLLKESKKKELNLLLKKQKTLIEVADLDYDDFYLRSFYFKKSPKNEEDLLSQIPQNKTIYKLLHRIKEFRLPMLYHSHKKHSNEEYYDYDEYERTYKDTHFNHYDAELAILDNLDLMSSYIENEITILYKNTFNPFIYRKHNFNLSIKSISNCFKMTALKPELKNILDYCSYFSTPDEDALSEYVKILQAFQSFLDDEKHYLFPLYKYWKSESL